MVRDLEKILAAGNLAPSGDNSQPWRFEVRDTIVDVFIDGEARERRPLLDYCRRPTYLSHGALLENISIAADHYGYYADITLLPDDRDYTHTARIELREDTVDHKVNLFDYVGERVTNREKYRKKRLTEAQKHELKRAPALVGVQGEIRFVEEQSTIRALAQHASVYDQLLLTQRELHKNLYDILRWTRKEAEAKRNGLYVKTLGLSLFDQLMLRYVLRFWIVARLLALFGIHRYAARKGRVRYRNASAYGAIVLDSIHESDFLTAGRIMERLWLLATRSGLCIHPTYAVMLLAAPVLGGVDVGYSKKQEEMLKSAVRSINELFGIAEGEHLLFVFRIGEGKRVRHRSYRKKPKVTFE